MFALIIKKCIEINSIFLTFCQNFIIKCGQKVIALHWEKNKIYKTINVNQSDKKSMKTKTLKLGLSFNTVLCFLKCPEILNM